MARVITLTTDFGLDDVYVGVLKGVILGVNPRARIIDLCHSIEPQNIAQASFLLAGAVRYFPLDSIHLVVIDPGVGAVRKALAVRTFHPPAFYVAPDNGLLSFLVPPSAAASPSGSVSLSGMEDQLLAYEITDSRFWRKPVSATFHGRDVFAPVAAWLSRGHSVSAFGPRADSMVYRPLVEPERLSDGLLKGRVMHIDHFGNVITNFKAGELKVEEIVIEIAGRRIQGLAPTYSLGHDLMALTGSSGYVEIAFKNGSAAKMLNARIGDDVLLRKGTA